MAKAAKISNWYINTVNSSQDKMAEQTKLKLIFKDNHNSTV